MEISLELRRRDPISMHRVLTPGYLVRKDTSERRRSDLRDANRTAHGTRILRTFM